MKMTQFLSFCSTPPKENTSGVFDINFWIKSSRKSKKFRCFLVQLFGNVTNQRPISTVSKCEKMLLF